MCDVPVTCDVCAYFRVIFPEFCPDLTENVRKFIEGLKNEKEKREDSARNGKATIF